MKKINIILAALLAALAAAILYFHFASELKVDAAAAREGDSIRCELTLSNGSLFDFEYLEFILRSPEGAELDKPALSGATLGRLSQERETAVISGSGGEPCRLEIGYYVLGMRRSVTVTVQ